MDELRAAVRELADAPSAELADQLVEQLGRKAPSPELAAFICQTLELPALHEVRDSRGVAMRWRLVDRLLGLGFPHALYVAPEDLDYHRDRSRPGASLASTATAVVAFVSMVWAFLWGAIAVGAGSGLQPRYVLVVAVCAFFHGLLAMISSVRVAYGHEAPLLKVLGWAFFAGPLVALGADVLHPGAGGAVLWLGLPAMITAVLCAATAATSRPLARALASPDPEPLVPEAEHAGPARVQVR